MAQSVNSVYLVLRRTACTDRSRLTRLEQEAREGCFCRRLGNLSSVSWGIYFINIWRAYLARQFIGHREKPTDNKTLAAEEDHLRAAPEKDFLERLKNMFKCLRGVTKLVSLFISIVSIFYYIISLFSSSKQNFYSASFCLLHSHQLHHVHADCGHLTLLITSGCQATEDTRKMHTPYIIMSLTVRC